MSTGSRPRYHFSPNRVVAKRVARRLCQPEPHSKIREWRETLWAKPCRQSTQGYVHSGFVVWNHRIFPSETVRVEVYLGTRKRYRDFFHTIRWKAACQFMGVILGLVVGDNQSFSFPLNLLWRISSWKSYCMSLQVRYRSN